MTSPDDRDSYKQRDLHFSGTQKIFCELRTFSFFVGHGDPLSLSSLQHA